MTELEHKNANIWMEATKTMLQANGMEWLLEDGDKQTQINKRMRKTVEAATRLTMLGAIPTETKTGLG